MPTSIRGGATVTVTWSAATDPDGNLSGYLLQCCLNNGSWVQVYKGANTSFDDTVPFGSDTVQYRVQAFDTENEASDYRTSEVRTIINNVAPVISGSDQDLGTKTEPFTFTYTVTDEDGDQVSVTEVLESGGATRTLRTYTAQLGVENRLDMTEYWLYVPSGESTLTITADDGNGGKAARVITFTRTIGSIAASRAISTDAVVKRAMFSLFPQSQNTASDLVVQATNNPFDPNPVWEDVTQKVGKYVHVFENAAAQNGPGLAYRFRITPGATGKVVFDSMHVRFEQEGN